MIPVVAGVALARPRRAERRRLWRTAPQPVPPEVRALVRRAELVELVDRYLNSLDTSFDRGGFDPGWAREFFTDDVTLTFPIGSHVGRTGADAFTAEIMRRWALTHHHAAGYVVDSEQVAGPHEAELAWNVIATHVHPDGPPPPAATPFFQLGGRFTGSAVRTQTGWRLRRLALRIVWMTGAPAPDVEINVDQVASGRSPVKQ